MLILNEIETNTNAYITNDKTADTEHIDKGCKYVTAFNCGEFV